MAKFFITHTCGHTREVQLNGVTRERDPRLENMKTQHCWTCQHEAWQEGIKRLAIKNRAKAVALGFPDLTGSESQIEWAITIRQNTWDVMSRRLMIDYPRVLVLYRGDGTPQRVSLYHLADEEARRTFREQTQARWWIANKSFISTTPPPQVEHCYGKIRRTIEGVFSEWNRAGRVDHAWISANEQPTLSLDWRDEVAVDAFSASLSQGAGVILRTIIADARQVLRNSDYIPYGNTAHFAKLANSIEETSVLRDWLESLASSAQSDETRKRAM